MGFGNSQKIKILSQMMTENPRNWENSQLLVTLGERERETASMLARHNVQGCRPRYVRYDRAVTVKVWDSCNLPIPIEGFAQRGILDHFMPKESLKT